MSKLWCWNQIGHPVGLAVLLGLLSAAADALPVLSSPIAQNTIAQNTIAQSDVLTRAEIYRLRNQVELEPFNQAARAAKLSDVLVPKDALRTAAASVAELLFNEGSIARVDASSVFRFREGLRRFQLSSRASAPVAVKAAVKNLDPVLAQAVLRLETIFVLDSGTALLMSPPNGTGTEVETPESSVTIVAPEVAGSTADSTAPGDTTESGLLLPPERSSAVMVVHNPQTNSTRVFALTDGDIRVFNRAGTRSTALIGGQTVAVTNGVLGPVSEFDLRAFYRTVPLAEGLGPRQEELVAQEPAPVQVSLNAVRIETLAAVRRQIRDRTTFTGSFLRDALNGGESEFNRDFDGQRGRRTELIIGGERDDGTFQRSVNDRNGSDIVRGSFLPDPTPSNPEPRQVNIEADLNQRTITINGQRGRSSDAGLSGNNAVGTVQLDSGRVIRLEIFDVGGSAPEPGETYRGRLIQGGLQPDR
jgi:hypothetical protein